MVWTGLDTFRNKLFCEIFAFAVYVHGALSHSMNIRSAMRRIVMNRSFIWFSMCPAVTFLFRIGSFNGIALCHCVHRDGERARGRDKRIMRYKIGGNGERKTMTMKNVEFAEQYSQ